MSSMELDIIKYLWEVDSMEKYLNFLPTRT